MPYQTYSNKFNRGEVDDDALYRDDVEKVKDSSREIRNFLPMRLGGAQYRPGLEYLGDMNFTNEEDTPYLIPFVKSLDDKAIIEFNRGGQMRVWIEDGETLLSRPSVSTVVTNGTFGANINGWTTAVTGTGIVTWSSATGTMKFLNQQEGSTGRASQIISSVSTGIEHSLRIQVIDDPIKLSLGNGVVGDDTYFSGFLSPGIHSLTFTPTGDISITLDYEKLGQCQVDNINFEAAGTFNITDGTGLTIPLDVANSNIRFVQSVDVIYVATDTGRNFKIERRGIKSWSLVASNSIGPFAPINNTEITMDPTALSGVSQILASSDYFDSSYLGATIRLISEGQERRATLAALNATTDSVRVLGVDNGRDIFISLQGSFSASVALEQSVDEVSWVQVASYGGNTQTIYNDGYENASLYYRLRVNSYTSGAIVTILRTSGGSITGIGRIIEVNSSLSVTVNVITPFGSVQPTKDWYISDWHENGFPSAVTIYEGRLWWFGINKYWGSVSDQYETHDEFLVGDERSISGTIGFGPVENVTWAAPLERIVMGTVSDEPALKSNSFGDPITSTNRNVKRGSGRGAALVDIALVDGKAYFVQAGGKKLMELDYTVGNDRYAVNDLTTLNPDVAGDATIVRIAVSTEPDTRIWCVLSDGSVAVLLIDRTENVLAWSHIDSRRYLNNGSDSIQDVVVLPESGEDRVFFVVERPRTVATITTHYRYLERMGKFSEMTRRNSQATGIMPMFDSFTRYTNPGASVSGLTRLEGQIVSYFADGEFRTNTTVVAGQISLNSPSYQNVVVGAGYDARLVTGVIQYGPRSSLMIHKRILQMALILKDYVVNGLSFNDAKEFATRNMPWVEDGENISSTFSEVKETYHQEPFPFPGTSETDPEVLLYAVRPVRIMAMRLLVEEHNDDTSDLER